MTTQEKIARIKELETRIAELQKFLNTANDSRKKAGGTLKNDSYPTGLKLFASVCTGSENVIRGDDYDEKIKDRDTLEQIINIIVPFIEERKTALTNELQGLLGHG